VRDINQMKERAYTLAWTIQRYDYYLAGRTLWFSNQMAASAIMLAYAIEAHIKHNMNAHRSKFSGNLFSKLINKHDLPMLFQKCREVGLFSDVEVSDDLLRFAQDNFHRRYPSQTIQSAENAKHRGHSLGMHMGVILAYDDFVLQLDQSLLHTLHNVRASVAWMGGRGANTAPGRFFFHSNHTAVELLEDIINMIKEEFSIFLKEEHESLHEINRLDCEQKLSYLSDKKRLLMVESIPMSINPGQASNNFHSHAKNFVYPGRYYEMPDGSTVSTIGFGAKNERIMIT
jgi:hypothetical protein